MNNFRFNFIKLLEASDKSQVEIARDLNFSKQKITNLKSGYSDPQLDDLIIISNYFNVTVDYLLKD